MRVVEEEELLAGEVPPQGIEQLEKRLRALQAKMGKDMKVREGLRSIDLPMGSPRAPGTCGQGGEQLKMAQHWRVLASPA